MSAPNWAIGRTGQLYVIEESAFDTSTTLASSNALRHLNFSAHYDPKSFRKSPERHADPSQRVLLAGRAQANWGIKAQLYPSGTLNTLPEFTALMKNAFGAAPTNITLSTTVASGAGVGGAVVASATGLAVGQAIQIVVLGGAAPGTYIRFLTGVSSTTLTWAPNLPATCAVSDTVKGAVTYTPGTTLPKSLDICHYPGGSGWYNREILGAVPNKLGISLDGSVEPMFDISGPACEMVSAQSQPGSFTTVGAENAIPSGLTGSFYYGNTAYEIEKLQFDLDNGMDLHNTALGTNKANAMYRKGKRAITIKVNAKVSDDLTLWTPSLTPSSGTLFVQIGTAAAKIFGLYIPVAQIMNPPDTPDGDETNNWDFTFTALGTSGNDEAYFGCA